MNKNAQKRQQVLTVLYQHRQAHAGQREQDQWLPLVELKQAVDDIEFALSVLAELKYIQRSGHLLRITGLGVLACEAGDENGL